jgi:micrococcal nuclease
MINLSTVIDHLNGSTRLRYYRAHVTGVADGDTLDLVIDIGFGLTMVDRVRMYGPDLLGPEGINCPEKNTPEGVAAKKFTTDLMNEADHNVVLVTDRDKRE